MTDQAPPDDLEAPLGVKPKPEKKKRFLPPFLVMAAALIGFAVTSLGSWVVLANNPLGGEPRAVASITPAPARPAEPEVKPAEPARAETPEQNGSVVNIIDGMSGRAREVRLAAPPVDRSSGLDPRLTERGRHGPLPKTSEDGRRPVDVYARAVRPTPGRETMPRIAIIVTGLGISANGTSEAISKLPGAISFAFAPYGSDLDRQVARARADGHEVFLQIPMEPFDYPENDPGPQTLLTTLAADRNLDRLHWVLSRAQGYAGVMNYMGAKFTASEQALNPVLRDIGKRGLMFIDDGTSPRSLVNQVAAGAQLPTVRVEIAIDRVPTPSEVDAALGRLETKARETGTAIGVATALPVAIDRIAAWARALEQRGVQLVPITALLPRRGQG
ncbi:MAG: divergent polysaccharide deacetylase family protein [Alphaproteobacteria bacterium]